MRTSRVLLYLSVAILASLTTFAQSPGGSNGSVQYNNTGAFAGDTYFTYVPSPTYNLSSGAIEGFYYADAPWTYSSPYTNKLQYLFSSSGPISGGGTVVANPFFSTNYTSTSTIGTLASGGIIGTAISGYPIMPVSSQLLDYRLGHFGRVHRNWVQDTFTDDNDAENNICLSDEIPNDTGGTYSLSVNCSQIAFVSSVPGWAANPGSGYDYLTTAIHAPYYNYSAGIKSFLALSGKITGAGDINIYDENLTIKPAWIGGSDEGVHEWEGNISEAASYLALGGTYSASPGSNSLTLTPVLPSQFSSQNVMGVGHPFLDETDGVTVCQAGVSCSGTGGITTVNEANSAPSVMTDATASFPDSVCGTVNTTVTGIVKAAYSSGLSVTGSGTGTITLTSFSNATGATATIPVTSGVIASTLTITNPGYNATTGSGTAAASYSGTGTLVGTTASITTATVGVPRAPDNAATPEGITLSIPTSVSSGGLLGMFTGGVGSEDLYEVVAITGVLVGWSNGVETVSANLRYPHNVGATACVGGLVGRYIEFPDYTYNTSAVVSSGTYLSGITATGAMHDTCTLTAITNPIGESAPATSATATVALTGTNTIAAGTALGITTGGAGAVSGIVTATVSSGTASCSGTATISIATASQRYVQNIFSSNSSVPNGGTYNSGVTASGSGTLTLTSISNAPGATATASIASGVIDTTLHFRAIGPSATAGTGTATATCSGGATCSGTASVTITTGGGITFGAMRTGIASSYPEYGTNTPSPYSYNIFHGGDVEDVRDPSPSTNGASVPSCVSVQPNSVDGCYVVLEDNDATWSSGAHVENTNHISANYDMDRYAVTVRNPYAQRTQLNIEMFGNGTTYFGGTAAQLSNYGTPTNYGNLYTTGYGVAPTGIFFDGSAPFGAGLLMGEVPIGGGGVAGMTGFGNHADVIGVGKWPACNVSANCTAGTGGNYINSYYLFDQLEDYAVGSSSVGQQIQVFRDGTLQFNNAGTIFGDVTISGTCTGPGCSSGGGANVQLDNLDSSPGYFTGDKGIIYTDAAGAVTEDGNCTLDGLGDLNCNIYSGSSGIGFNSSASSGGTGGDISIVSSALALLSYPASGGAIDISSNGTNGPATGGPITINSIGTNHGTGGDISINSIGRGVTGLGAGGGVGGAISISTYGLGCVGCVPSTGGPISVSSMSSGGGISLEDDNYGWGINTSSDGGAQFSYANLNGGMQSSFDPNPYSGADGVGNLFTNHLIGGQYGGAPQPTVAVQGAAGTGASATIDGGGSDIFFNLIIIAGSAPSAGAVAVITFGTSYTATPHCTAYPSAQGAGNAANAQNAAAVAGVTYGVTDNVSFAAWTLYSTLVAGTTYSWDVHCGQ